MPVKLRYAAPGLIMITYERSTLSEQRKVYWAGRSSSNDLGGGDGFPGQNHHGIHSGDQSLNPSGVLGWTARQLVRDLRRRHLGGLALRSTQAACHRGSGVQSAQDSTAQTGQQE